MKSYSDCPLIIKDPEDVQVGDAVHFDGGAPYVLVAIASVDGKRYGWNCWGEPRVLDRSTKVFDTRARHSAGVGGAGL